MATTKHKLTKNTDKIDGDGSNDLFLAPLQNGKATLSDTDALDGKGGFDILEAVLAVDELTLHAKNIEKGIFSRKGVLDCDLDLAEAKAMSELVFNNFHNLLVTHSDFVTSIMIRKHDSSDVNFNDIDTDSHQSIAIAVSDSDGPTLYFDTKTSTLLDRLEVTLRDASVNLYGGAIGDTVIIHSDGTDNGLYFTQDDVDARVRKIVIDGSGDLDFGRMSGLPDLVSIDASKARGSMGTTLDGSTFLNYRGSRGADFLSVGDLGGSVGHKAVLNLGKGRDGVDGRGFTFDGALHHISGGAGYDDLLILGGISNSSGFLDGVEQLRLVGATGSYHLLGSAVEHILFANAATGTTVFDGLKSGATLDFFQSQSAGVMVSLANAAASKTDRLHVDLTAGSAIEGSAVTLGSFTTGLSAPGLSNLGIESSSQGFSGSNMIVLGSVGDASNPLSITFTGTHHLLVGATTTAQSYIAEIRIENGAGVDLSGLAWGIQSLDPDGATIIGGKGDDHLIGGDGDDLIRTAGGDNGVTGSGGADRIVLAANSGLDVLIFDSASLSVPDGTQTTVTNFGSFDSIDVGDMVSNLTFNGNVASRQAGLAVLSNVHASAFFDQSADMLYIDVNHDKAIDAAHDFALHLDGVTSLTSGNLID